MHNLNISFTEFLLNDIQEKTLLICCSDFYEKSISTRNKNIIMYSSFANSIHPEEGFHTDMLHYHLECDQIKRIVVVGHVKCEIIKFLISEDNFSEKWALTKDELKETLVFLRTESNVEETQKDIVKMHVVNQLLKLQNIEFIKRLTTEKSLRIEGIVVDELNQNQVTRLETCSF